MSSLETVMQYYAYLFHPGVVLGAGATLIIHREWVGQAVDRSALYRRVGAFLGAGVLSLLPTAAYMLATGKGPVEMMQGNAAQVDFLVAGGIVVAAGTTWAVWRYLDWGSIVPHAMVTYVAVGVPYAGLSPFWNVSGHVLLSLTPALYLTLLDRSYWPVMLVPIVMVPNRRIVGAHSWAQAVGAFLIGSAVVVAAFRLSDRRSAVASTDPADAAGSRRAG
jgi:hypothetical protein